MTIFSTEVTDLATECFESNSAETLNTIFDLRFLYV